MANIILLVLAWILLGACEAKAQTTMNFSEWLQQLEQEAISNGISPDVVHEALDNISPIDRVVELDQKQPEKTVTFDHYVHHVASSDRIEEGRELLANNAKTLREISNRYGVQPQVIVALWGIESSFGQDSGHFNIVDSLATLAYEGRRADFFRKELLDALRILEKEQIPSSSLRGSWAGAMGQCQFMPSTYLKYAVDYDQNGSRDIWNSRRDVWASIANYLASEGWNSELTWGREVELEETIPADEIGLDHKHLLREWAAMGVHSADGSALPNKSLEASLVQPDGVDGRSFLVYDNFRALMRWNRSTYFATTVGLLADRIK